MKKKSRSTKFILFFVTLMLSLVLIGLSHEGKGPIKKEDNSEIRAKCLVAGRVFDRFGEPVVGAKVCAKYPDESLICTFSQEDGYYGEGSYAVGVNYYPEYADVWAKKGAYKSPTIRIFPPFPVEPLDLYLTIPTSQADPDE